MNEDEDLWTAYVSSAEHASAFITRFESQSKRTSDPFDQFNFATVLMESGEFPLAESLLEKVVETEESGAGASMASLLRLGVAKWHKGDLDLALKCWGKAAEAKFVDDCGGITAYAFVWYGAKLIGDKNRLDWAISNISRLCKSHRFDSLNRWPGSSAIGGFVLGRISEPQLLNQLRADAGTLEVRRLCRVNFWCATKCLDLARRDKLLKLATIDRRASLEDEYCLALVELVKVTQ